MAALLRRKHQLLSNTMKSLILLIFLTALQANGNPIPNSNSLDFEHHIIPRPRPRPDVAQDVMQGTISNLLVKYKNSDLSCTKLKIFAEKNNFTEHHETEK